MERLITTHTLRKTCQPTPLWQLTAPQQLGTEKLLMAVPGAWQGHARMDGFRGVGTYTKEMTLAGNVRFLFGGAGGAARVFLDGQELLQEKAADGSFACLAEGLDWGKHCLRVDVDSSRGDVDCGGLTRPVTVEQLGSAWLRKLHAEPFRQGRLWKLRVQAEVSSLCEEDQQVEVELKAAGVELRWRGKHLPARGTLTLTGELPMLGVKSWEPARPVLYPLHAVLWQEGVPADDLMERIGFREAPEALLRGREPEDFLPDEEAPLTELVQQVQQLKARGCTAVRLPWHACAPRLLDLCDQCGLLVLPQGGAAEDTLHPCVVQA